ncbi:uncharacterized protein LOC110978001 isoform X4 [Acanthaster planci]|uniref:Uncharacterized protein LOC110978001 isoform X4 n=1 Tax=Acanthaster planci TaxID=133434 RepID=A0A8B7Y7I5_ACAPL|nr:uncharacterized protein LOC110978001 isoform X4 [Acanthaster planci]
MAERLRRDPLPPQWSYGVKSDGRIFFINEETRSTTWLHPVTGKAISTGYSDRDDLPPGWQEGITREGVAYFMNHHTGETTFNHPITHKPEADDEFFLIDRTQETPPYHRPKLAPLQMTPNNPAQSNPSRYATSPSSDPASPSYATTAATPNQPTTPTSPTTPISSERPSFRKRIVPKESAPALKRRRDAVATMEGWLFKQDSGALKAWRKRWCVLADYCLFYYKGSDKTRSESGSILLPSYQISPVGPQDKITRKYAFKCEHENMRTYYFAAENQVDMNQWIRAMKLAANAQLERRQQYDDDDARFRGHHSQSPDDERDNEEWLFRSPKELNGTMREDYEDNPHVAQHQNGFDPDGRLPREPEEANDHHFRNGDDYYTEDAPEGYWEARERYVQNNGRYPEKNRGHGPSALERANPPAIYDYPPDEDIDGYSSPEEGKQELRERFRDEEEEAGDDDEKAHQSQSDSERVDDKELSDREEFGMDRGRDPHSGHDDRRKFHHDDDEKPGERSRYNSRGSGDRPPQPGALHPPSDMDAGGYATLRLPQQQDGQEPSERLEDPPRRDRYSSLSESDQDRQIIPTEERLVSSVAPMHEAGYHPRERPGSGQRRKDPNSASPEDDRGTARSRDSQSSRASQDRHGGRRGDRHGGDPRRSWDRGSGSVSSRDDGQRPGRSIGGGRRGNGPAPHSPGQYPESYNTLPRPRSKSRERSSTEEGQFPESSRNSNKGGSLDRHQMPHYDSSTTDSLPSPSGEPTSHPLGGGGRRPPYDDPRRMHSLDQRHQRPRRDSDSQSDSRHSSRGERSPAPQGYWDREGRRRDPREMQGTRSLDRDRRPQPQRSSTDSLPREGHQRATLPPDYRSPDARRHNFAEHHPLAQDLPDSDISKVSTPPGSAPGSVDGRMRVDPETGSLRRDDRRGDPRRSDPRGDPRRDDLRGGNPLSDPRHNRRSDPRGDPRQRDPRGDPRRDARLDQRSDLRWGDPHRGYSSLDRPDDPRQHDPRGQPRRADPRDDPRRGDPRGDPRRDDSRDGPRRRDPRDDPRRGDPRQSDPRRGGPRGDHRVDRRSDPQRGRPGEDGRREMQGRRPPEPLHFKFPKTGEIYPSEVTPEQRSLLQSPLAQPGHDPWTPEQRADINSPLAYPRNEPEWPTSRPEAYYRARERQAESDRDMSAQHSAERQPLSDYVPQQVEAVIQRSAPTNETFASAPPLPSEERYPEEQRPANYDRPRRFASSITEEGVEGTTEADIAPRRARNANSKRRSERNTLERNEFNSGDQLAPLAGSSGSNKGPREPTSRFKKWQMKAQPYILLSTGIRLRLSIAAGDLLGKSHEELVLLLIQLRRDQSNLKRWLEMIDQELALLADPASSPPGSPTRMRARHSDSLHRRSNPNLSEDREFLEELSLERVEVERELEISRPLVRLVDNLVRMGSLYGGQNQMIAQEFYRDKVQKDLNYIEPKKLIEFSRRLEEEKLNRDLKGELQQIQTAEDRLLEEKLSQLHRLDKRLQEMSAHVSLLKEDKDKIEASLDRLGRQMDRHWDEPDIRVGMEDQQHRLERDLVKVRTQLANGTKELEEVAAENGKIEYEVSLLRSKLDAQHQRSTKSPHEGANTKERLQMENEVTRVQSLLENLDKQRNQLANQMQTLRTGPAETYPEKIQRHRREQSPRTPKQYAVTDLDTMLSHDISASPATPAAASDSGWKSAPPLRRREDSIKKVRQIKEQQVQQSPVLESVASSTAQSSYHASPQILHPQPRYQQPPMQQMEQPQIYPNQENQYYSSPSTNHRRGRAPPQERVRNGPSQQGWYGDGNPANKRHTIGGYEKRSKGPRPESKYHTISRTGEIIPGSPMRRTRSVPDQQGLMAGDDRKSSAMDRLMPGIPYKNTSYDPYHGAVSDTEADPAASRAKKKSQSLRASDGAQLKAQAPALRLLRSARSQTLPGRFTDGPQTPPVFDNDPLMTPDLTNSWDEGTTNRDGDERRWPPPEPNRRHTFSGHPLGPQARPFAKGVQDDIAIHELQKALIDPDEVQELDILEPSGPRPSDIISGKYKPVEVDESTGGGLSYAHLAFVPHTYFQAKRKLLREWFFASTESTPPQLGLPAKIIIPERYLPDDDDEPAMTQEERERHEERVDRITKMLSAHRIAPEFAQSSRMASKRDPVYLGQGRRVPRSRGAETEGGGRETGPPRGASHEAGPGPGGQRAEQGHGSSQHEDEH